MARIEACWSGAALAFAFLAWPAIFLTPNLVHAVVDQQQTVPSFPTVSNEPTLPDEFLAPASISSGARRLATRRDYTTPFQYNV